MKKNIILLAASLALTSVGMSSCEDMLDPKSDLVMYESDNQLKTANDTLYSVMGVVSLMQKVADRTNLLGEVRGDLVTLTADATTALREVANFTADSSNVYNKPQDYYAIVNNCNYFIQTVDTTYAKRGQKIFEREYVAMKTFRAWAYLQLAINYREVPFYTDFLSTKEQGEAVMREPRKGIREICDYFIADLAPYVNVAALDYQEIDDEPSAKFFIPVRVMLGDLCLWAGRYSESAQFYHDYIADVDDPKPIQNAYTVAWSTASNPSTGVLDSYYSVFTHAEASEWLTFIPMAASAFSGEVTSLYDIYCSTTDNKYYYQVTKSQALVDLSAAQSYYYVYVENNVRDTVCMSDSIYTNPYLKGDLRLYAMLTERSIHSSSTSMYSGSYQEIYKVSDFRVCLYRLSEVYLRYAEALNRAGYPSAAFAILKYGLYNERLNNQYIAQQELDRAGTLLTFNQYNFTRSNTIGIHARGCGDVDANPEYVLPQPAEPLGDYADTVAYQIPLVEDLICEEMALETCFEGQRFYDLMRIALRRNDPDYLASRVAARDGASALDAALYAKLLNVNTWFLPLGK